MAKADTAASGSGDAVAGVQAVLLEMLPHVIEVYRGLAELAVADDPRLVTAQQQACKAALAHLEALMKLIRLAAPPGEVAGDGGDGGGGSGSSDGLIARARDAFDSYRGEDE